MVKKIENEEILAAFKTLSEKVESLSDVDDLEKGFEVEEPKKRSQMLDIDPERIDSFGDPIELTTKSRLANNQEAFNIAKNFVKREYHNMIGNRYGKHSKLIPIFNEDGTKNKIDMVWFSGNPVALVEINDVQYYKVRLLVRDILTKKVLLSRIPTSDGKARGEEIEHIGARAMSDKWADHSNLNAMKPINYPNKGNKATMKDVGEQVFES